MAITYASKYSGKVDERFKLASVTRGAVNNEYDFVGVNAVNVYSIPTVALGDYTISGTSRFGTPAELQNAVQTLTISQDKAFTFVIDKKSTDSTMGAMQAGAALRREVDEVITPTVDIYTIGKIVAGTTPAGNAALTKANVYAAFLDGQAALTDAKIPATGRVCFAGTNFYKLIKQDSAFMLNSDMGQQMVVNGAVGTIDGVAIIPVPASYLPENIEFVITHPSVTCQVLKLTDYRVHEDAPGISGYLVEGRIMYDAFVLDSKTNGIYAYTRSAS